MPRLVVAGLPFLICIVRKMKAILSPIYYMATIKAQLWITKPVHSRRQFFSHTNMLFIIQGKVTRQHYALIVDEEAPANNE